MYEQIDLAEYLYGISMKEIDFMVNDAHEIQYNEVCEECRLNCKQSFRCDIIECPKYTLSRRSRSKKE